MTSQFLMSDFPRWVVRQSAETVPQNTGKKRALGQFVENALSGEEKNSENQKLKI